MINVCFFFKHNTAYELRIRDWSSDVCASDLPWPNRGNPLQQIVRVIGDVEKFLRRNLRGARIGIIRKLNCSAFQALAFKLLAERQTQHSQPLPTFGGKLPLRSSPLPFELSGEPAGAMKR